MPKKKDDFLKKEELTIAVVAIAESKKREGI